MPISITNRTEKGSALTNAEMDAILEALAASLGVVISSTTPANEDCPMWFDTVSLSLKVWDGSAWNEIKSGGGAVGAAFV